jgi:hypothetical protein
MVSESAIDLELHSLSTHLHISRILIRKATIEDLDVMVDIALAAMPQDPQWDWRFPHRLQFPDDTRRFTRIKYEEFLTNTDGEWLVILAEHRRMDGVTPPKPIAMAIWNVKNLLASRLAVNVLQRKTKCWYEGSYEIATTTHQAFYSEECAFRSPKHSEAGWQRC